MSLDSVRECRELFEIEGSVHSQDRHPRGDCFAESIVMGRVAHPTEQADAIRASQQQADAVTA